MSTYILAIGNRSYSSWSLRGWLMLDAFGLSAQSRLYQLYSSEMEAFRQDFAPARSLPTLKIEGEGLVLESLAIAEELASRHPEAGHWPKAPAARAAARSAAAEMHAGFTALRSHCPMNLRVSYQDCAPTEAVLADLQRLEALWAFVRAQSGGEGPWLCGAYSAVDAFFAPVAARIAGYNLPVAAENAAYVAAHLAHPSFRRWRAMGLAEGAGLEQYIRPYPTRPWPGPAPLAAKAVAGREAENAACPYSGRPVEHVLELDGRRIGFCHAFCRDKTVADPEAWPAFMALWRGAA